MLRSVFLKSLLVVALLFAQQGAVTHGISHILAEQTKNQSVPHDKHCDLCSTYAQIGCAIGSNPVQFDFASSFEEARPVQAASLHSSSFTAFAARAPPRFA